MKIFSRFGISKLNFIVHNFIRRANFWRDYGIPVLFIILFFFRVYHETKHTPDHPLIMWDFDNAYYPAGRIILENPDNLYNSYLTLIGFVNLPIVAYLFTQFSLLSKHSAESLFTILGCLCILVAGYVFIKIANVSGWRRTVLIVLLAIYSPLYNSIMFGNTTHFVLLLLLGAFFCFRAKRDIWSGVLLASAALIKLPLLFLSIYFVIRGRWRVVAAFCLMLLTVVVSSLLLFGWDLNLTWFNRCVLAFSNKAICASNVQSVDAFLIRLLTNCRVDGLDSLIPIKVGWEFKLMRYALLSLLIGGTMWLCWYLKQPQTSEAENLEFCIFLCLALLISPISWSHYYLLLIIPFSLYVSDRLAIPKKWSWFSLMLLSILLVSLQDRDVTTLWFNNSVLSTILARDFRISHDFWGGILLLGTLLAARWQTSKG